MRRSHLILMVASLGVAAAFGAGCATKTVAPPPAADTGPLANSPASAVKRFEWAMNHRSAETVRELLTDDFVFIGIVADSAGNASRDSVGDRGWFAAALAALDSLSEQVTCVMDANPVSFSDSRPGKDPRFHRQVRSAFDLRVRIDAGNTVEVSGDLLFFTTRGDSAQIPAEFQARGVRPDSTRWWFDRQEDETLGVPGPPAATKPSRNTTFASLLEFFLPRIAQ